MTGSPNCGPSDDLGHCMERYHSAGCGSSADPEIGLAMLGGGRYAEIARRPLADQHGRVWADQNGAMGMAEHFEAATGTRVQRTLFEQGAARPELSAPQRQARFGDPDADDDRGFDAPRSTRQMASRLAAQVGITPGSAAREREQARTDPRRAYAQARTMTRLGDGDGIVSARDRAERLHRTVTTSTMRQLDEPLDGLTGALPRYTAGSL